jgi:YidC/Oxa1 family membrane protein insertase
MDRSTVLRWSIIAGLMLLVWQFGPKLFGEKAHELQPIPAETYANAPGFAPDVVDPVAPGEAPPSAPAEGELCTIEGNRFRAELSSRGAAIKHFWLTDARYTRSDSADLSTTPDVERWRSLRTTFRGDGANDQLPYDRFNWELERQGTTACKFTHKTDTAEITKVVRAGERPFELHVETTVKNLADAPRTHTLAIGAFDFRHNDEVKGHLGRVSPFVTELSCARSGDVTRKARDDFKKTGWYSEAGVDRYTAVSNYYFGKALMPVGSAPLPECRVLAEEWVADGQAADDDKAGAVYHAQLAYPNRTLAPNEAVTYEQIAFFGPKERDILRDAGGGKGLGSLINLGFFSPVAKVLVSVLLFFHDHVTLGSWGLAIIALTLCVRILLFPLTWKTIKTTIEMRRLKPELDALNAKFEGDMQAKNLAMMELYRKHKINPLGGCLPSLAQMPIWFAMYTTLQTAVEMYHTEFLWFNDLSEPDRFYVLPLLLGGFMILQQRIVPQQGMDPMQQKMMLYMMPAIFTVMMLFLPAALGVYMLTNSILGIVQQLAVEKIAPRSGPPSGEIVVTQVDSTAAAKKPSAAMLGKGKARV